MSGSGTVVGIASGLAFASVALFVFTLSQLLARRDRLRRRHEVLLGHGPIAAASVPSAGLRLRVEPARLGLDASAQRALRSELVKAGFFDPGSVSTFAIVRLAGLVALPALGLLVIPNLFGVWGLVERGALAIVLVAIGSYAPRAFLKRRQRELSAKHQLTFPNFLDMLVVCVNAGLSLDAALDRAGRELGRENAAFRANLDWMAAERRAGKSTADALHSLAGRLGFREAQSFAALLQQTIELGTDVAAALTTFADEMRDKRMAKAEEKAASLPPKLTLPLGLFIFPVVLIAILAPAVVRVLGALRP